MGCGCCKDEPPACYNGEKYSGTRKHCKRPDPNCPKEWKQGVGAAKGVEDWALNPIITAPSIVNWIVGDPTVMQVDEEIHMFTNGALGDIQHYVAKTSDPTCFKELSPAIRGFGTVRPYIFHDKANNIVTLFYEQYKPLFFNSSVIMARQAEVGKWNFGSPKTILEPTLDWEKEGQSRCGNAFVYYNKVKGKYWLYYSCSRIRLDDSAIDEPKYFGLAEADNILGPYTRVLQKPMEIRGEIPGETVKGYGSLKIIKNPLADIGENGVGVALCNRLTLEEATGRSGSTISLIKTTDGGLSWDTVIPKFIGPSLIEDDWKMAYVYAFDTLINPLDNKTELVYYNARNGYKDAYEEAGVSRFPVEMIEEARNC